MDNSTVSDLPPLPFFTERPLQPLIPGFKDEYLSLALPIVAYWVVSLIFHLVDEYDLFPQYRLHTPAEVLKRNHVSRWEVLRDVLLQQIIQTIFGLGLAVFEPVATVGKEQYHVAVWAQRIRIAQRAVPGIFGLLGVDASRLAQSMGQEHPIISGVLAGGAYPSVTQTLVLAGRSQVVPGFATWELALAKAIYHLVIPALQFTLAICIVDTWQYFLHRAMHMNKWLYTTFHARHHRLYVPYAYGALYNHPVEGFMLDTLGTGLAYLISGMTCRQSMWFFTMSTIKTVDDHCGYAFPWDPLQHLTSNNAGYHDIHHQSWGIKTNFSQPFFTFWDALLGTKWIGGDVSGRYERAKLAAQKKIDAELSSQLNDSSGNETRTKRVYSKGAEDASAAACATLDVALPKISGTAARLQAVNGRQQVLDDQVHGGIDVIVAEHAEEAQAQKQPVRLRKDLTKGKNFKGLADRLSDSLRTSPGVLGVENRRR